MYPRHAHSRPWPALTATACLLFTALFIAGPALAHFGMVVPSASTVTDKADATISLDIAFAHPMARQGMPMGKPEAFRVMCDGTAQDLLPALRQAELLGHPAWRASYTIRRPGVYQFAVTPEPYFEPAENRLIIHYAKTVVAAFGEEEGWDRPLGLKTEIVPLTRPFANYAGNVFAGRVLLDGKPVPGAEVEVEYWNRDNTHTPPNEYYVTQVVRADQDGVFVYGVPWAGWWGFAALSEDSVEREHEGRRLPVELGAVLWMEFAAPQTR